jgi:ABC-type polysaccharide/polyol phosphate transport system ATPase subunit
VLSSHSLEIVRKICNVVCWMERGQIVMTGPADVVLPAYLKGLQRPLAPVAETRIVTS